MLQESLSYFLTYVSDFITLFKPVKMTVKMTKILKVHKAHKFELHIFLKHSFTNVSIFS